MEPIRSILVAVDFSKHSDAAVDAAIELAGKLGAKIHVVHAFDLRLPMLSPYEIAIPEPYIEQSREAAAGKLKAVVDRVAAAGVEVQSHLSEIPAAQAVAATAESVGADLIVMGTHGHTGLKHLFLGSVAERTLRSAPCSVWVVKLPG